MFYIDLEAEPPPQVPAVEVVASAEPEGDKSLTPRYFAYLIKFLNHFSLYLFLKLCLSSTFVLSV